MVPPRATRRLTALVCGCAVTVAAWPASAQTSPAQAAPRAFVDLGGFADGDTTLSITAAGALPRGHALGVPGATLGAGAVLTERVSLRVEAQLPAWHDEQYPFVLLECGGAACVPTPIDRRHSGRTPTVTGLVGYRWPWSGRVGLVLMGGGGLAARQLRLWNTPAGTSQNGSPPYSTTELVPTVSYGLDADVALSARVSLVAQLRGHREWGAYFTRGSVLRPGLAARVRF